MFYRETRTITQDYASDRGILPALRQDRWFLFAHISE